MPFQTDQSPTCLIPNMQQGTWSQDEHDRFLAGIKIYPDGPWRLIARYVGTRSVRQVQTHAQKYHEKIARRMRGLRKERRNHVRMEHRIDDDVFHLRGPPTVSYPPPQYPPMNYPPLHFPEGQEDYRNEVAATPIKLPPIQLPPLRLSMPPPTIEHHELPEEPTLDYFARAAANDVSSVVV